MTEIKLKDIEIKSFRGIKNYILDFDNKSLVLVGENGSGKSSIANAFEFLFTGKVESLTGSQHIKQKQSLVHLGDDKNDLLVSANIGNQTITRTLKQPPEDSDIVGDFENGSFLLNRQKLLSFINNTPKGRHDRITSLIGFEELDKIETVFYKTQKAFKNKVESKQEELKNKISSITDILDCQDDEIYDNFNKLLVKHNLEEISDYDDLEKISKELSKHDFNQLNQLNHLVESFDMNISELNNDFKMLLKDYKNATLYELKSVDTLLNILNKSSKYILNENPDNCPVCNQQIQQDNVLEFIDLKKKELNDKENSLQNWKIEYKKFNSELTHLNHSIKSIEKELDNFDEYKFNFDLDKFIEDLSQLAKFEMTLSEINADTLINLESEFVKLKNSISNDFEKLNNRESLDEINDMQTIIIKLKDKNEIESALKILEEKLKFASNTYETFKEEKLKKIEEIVENIERDVDNYYNFIHHGEEFNTPSIEAPDTKKITIDLNFNNVTADPRSYSSEGHLDSLGLCIFLAFVKQFNEYDFIILDDIVSTVDLGHKQRIAKLLFKEFKDYKFIITTHNKLWFRQLQNYANTQKFNFAEIRALGSLTGPILVPTLYDEDIIDRHIINGDTFAAGNAIRRYLESVLEKVCRTNSIEMPLKDHLMIGDYFTGIRRQFKELFKGQHNNAEIKAYYDDILERLDDDRYLGNLLSHNDDDNSFVSINEIEEFKELVFEFEKAMTCEKHETKYLIFDKEKRVIECSHRKCKFSLPVKTE